MTVRFPVISRKRTGYTFNTCRNKKESKGKNKNKKFIFVISADSFKKLNVLIIYNTAVDVEVQVEGRAGQNRAALLLLFIHGHFFRHPYTPAVRLPMLVAAAGSFLITTLWRHGPSSFTISHKFILDVKPTRSPSLFLAHSLLVIWHIEPDFELD